MKKKFIKLFNIIYKFKIKSLIFFSIELIRILGIKRFLTVIYLKIFTYAKIGKNINIGSNFHITPFSKISIGENFSLGHNCIIRTKHYKDKHKGIIIGNNVLIDSNFYLLCSDLCQIEDNVMIADNVSIRCNNHTISGIVRSQPMKIGKIIIEKNVWIGRGVFIQGGNKIIKIGRDSIIGANSFVKESVKPFSIVVGNPAKLIKIRKK